MKRRRCKQTSTNRTFTLKSKDSSHLASQQCYDSSVAPELNPQVNVGRITDSAQSSNSPATCSTCQSPHLSGFFVSSSPLETLSSKESCHVPECSQVPLSLSSESFSVQNGINRQDTYTINYNGVKTRTKEKEGPESKVAQLDSKCVANSRKRKFPRSLSDTILTIKHQCCVHGNIIPLEFLPRQKPLIEGNSNFKVVQHNESDRNSLVDESPEANERHFERSSGASSSQVSVIKSSLVAEPTYKHNTKAISRASSTCRKVSVKVTKLSSRDISAYTTSLSTHSSSPAVSHKTEATSPKSKVNSNICTSLSNSSALDPSGSHDCNRNTRSDKLSPYLSEDSLFRIASQGKACNHFILKLKENNNVQTSTQNSPWKKLQSSQSFCHCSATPFTSTLNSVKKSLRSFHSKSLHQESHHNGFILSETSTGKLHPNLPPTANVSNVLNQAYLIDSLKEVKDASGSRFCESVQELRKQSPSNSDHVASLCSDEGSKSMHKTSSNIRNSSTNSSSCIIESSMVLGEAIPLRGMNPAPSNIQDTENLLTKKSGQQNKPLINVDGELKLASNKPSISSPKTISPLRRKGNLSTELGSKKKISRRKKKKLYLRQKIRHRREIKKKKEFERLATISCTRNLRKSFRLKDCSVILDVSSTKNCPNLTSTSKENLSPNNMTSSRSPPHRAPTLSKDHSKGKSMLLLRDLKYFCVNVHQVDENFLDFHGLLPTLCVKPCAPQKRKRESNLPDCSDFMVNCKRQKMGPSSECKRDDSPNKQLITTSLKDFENSVPSEGFFLRTTTPNNAKKNLCLSATKKFQRTEATTLQSKEERGASTNTSSPVGGENSMHTSSSPVVKQEVETQLTEDSSSDEREKSYSTETIECVEAGLMHISPPISENLISAICGRCNKLIPYGTAETMVVSEETMWPNNKVPLCATKSCNGRLLYWGIFKAQLMLKTIKGEYLIAQINDPNAEKFFGCSAAQFFEDPAHKKRIQKRISELLLLNKGAEDIIMKKYTLIKIRNGNELRIRILHTSLFEP
nr:PREDICTED: uncharacterized protein LOC109041183 isoform X1 [Bemisia tabaci]